MIDGGLRPVVVEFIAEMLNDPCCESILLDGSREAVKGGGLPVLYLDVTGKRYGCTLSIVEGEYSAIIRDFNKNEAIEIAERETGAWELQGLLGEIKTKLRQES